MNTKVNENKDFNSLLQEKQALEYQLDQLNQEFYEVAKVEANEWAKGLFKDDKYPNLREVNWMQYFKSYVSDYSVNSDYDQGRNFEGFTPEQTQELQKEVGDFLKNFSENDLRQLFGDSSRVVITEDGLNVEAYDHN